MTERALRAAETPMPRMPFPTPCSSRRHEGRSFLPRGCRRIPPELPARTSVLARRADHDRRPAISTARSRSMSGTSRRPALPAAEHIQPTALRCCGGCALAGNTGFRVLARCGRLRREILPAGRCAFRRCPLRAGRPAATRSDTRWPSWRRARPTASWRRGPSAIELSLAAFRAFAVRATMPARSASSYMCRRESGSSRIAAHLLQASRATRAPHSHG